MDSDRDGSDHSRAVRGGDRRHQFPARTRHVFVRLSDDEYNNIAAAATRAELTPTGYVAEAALAAACNTTPPAAKAPTTGITRTELAQLQRELFAARTAATKTGTNLNQAVAALNTTGHPPLWLAHAVDRCQRFLDQLDHVVAAIDRRLR